MDSELDKYSMMDGDDEFDNESVEMSVSLSSEFPPPTLNPNLIG